MRLVDLTLPTWAENLALDEAFLLEADAADLPCETLRLWEPSTLGVVIGRASKVESEVELELCRRESIPVLRRTSGGLSIVGGPGCLMYSVILRKDLRPATETIAGCHETVLGTLLAGLSPHVVDLGRQGLSDLTIGSRKCSGNSLQIKRRAVLYHGTLLYDFPLETIARLLKTPPRAPDYRGDRPHRDFVTNLPLNAATLRAACISAWQAEIDPRPLPLAEVAQLAEAKYRTDAWNLER